MAPEPEFVDKQFWKFMKNTEIGKQMLFIMVLTFAPEKAELQLCYDFIQLCN